MNRQIFTLAHEITRNTVRKGDCYRTTFAAALPIARGVVESINQALSIFAEMETAPTRFHIPAIASRAGSICNAASRMLWRVNPATGLGTCYCPQLDGELFEVYLAATVGNSYKEAWEMLVCIFDDDADQSAAA